LHGSRPAERREHAQHAARTHAATRWRCALKGTLAGEGGMVLKVVGIVMVSQRAVRYAFSQAYAAASASWAPDSTGAP
jgi:hypothetical protein